jgi:hypothetical protein
MTWTQKNNNSEFFGYKIPNLIYSCRLKYLYGCNGKNVEAPLLLFMQKFEREARISGSKAIFVTTEHQATDSIK